MVILLYPTRAQSSLKICTRSKGKVVSLFNHPSIFLRPKAERTQQITKRKEKKDPCAKRKKEKACFSKVELN